MAPNTLARRSASVVFQRGSFAAAACAGTPPPWTTTPAYSTSSSADARTKYVAQTERSHPGQPRISPGKASNKEGRLGCEQRASARARSAQEPAPQEQDPEDPFPGAVRGPRYDDRDEALDKEFLLYFGPPLDSDMPRNGLFDFDSAACGTDPTAPRPTEQPAAAEKEAPEETQTSTPVVGVDQPTSPPDGSRNEDLKITFLDDTGRRVEARTPERDRPRALRPPDPAPSTSATTTTTLPRHYRIARIFGLASDTTLTDVLQGIAATAPVGRVLDIKWDRSGRATPHRGQLVKGARVLFDHSAAPVDLVRCAKQRQFRVRGQAPHVSVHGAVAFARNLDDAPLSSRVLCAMGSRDVEDFSEEGIRTLLLGNATVVRHLGELGLDAEAVTTTDWGGTQRRIVWRFFSNEKQVRVVLPILRRHFYRQLTIGTGRDPCWNEEVYPKQRASYPDATYLAGFAEAGQVPRLRRQFIKDNENTLRRKEMTWLSPERQRLRHGERAGASPYASGARPLAPWEDETDFIPTDADSEMLRENNEIQYEDTMDSPSESGAEHDTGWEQDMIPWEGSQSDAEQRRLEKLMNALKIETSEPMPLGDEKRNVGKWVRIQTMMESRGPQPIQGGLGRERREGQRPRGGDQQYTSDDAHSVSANAVEKAIKDQDSW